VRAERPPEVPPGAFGPRVTSLIGLLTGRYRLSKREVVSLVDEVCGVEVSVGSVVEATEQLSAALAKPYQHVAELVHGGGNPGPKIDRDGSGSRMMTKGRQSGVDPAT
jgi:transposase